nr:PAN domain-containing protein At5g03700 [Ziziphus jujuba var. spinosa]
MATLKLSSIFFLSFPGLCMERCLNSVTGRFLTKFVLVSIILLYAPILSCSKSTNQQELLKGFKATVDTSVPSFQALLRDPTGNLSLGFLKTDRTYLSLAVLHLPSSEPIWVANPTRLTHWSDRTRLIFDGNLVISHPHGKVVWSTGTQGDRVVLLNSSNLQVQKLDGSVLWQSFDFPTNSIVENQNFTTNMTLVSSNGRYSMRLGNDFMGLYANFKQDFEQIYWRHKAMEARARIIEGQGPIYARINPDGYLGMYQTGNQPVDVQPFNNFQRPINGLVRIRLEPDGNLKGYYWDGSNWVLNYQAIDDPCELPSQCGLYGLCRAGEGCSCLDNQTEFHPGECSPPETGDLCGGVAKNNFRVQRRKGVEVPFKELMAYDTMSSLEECESFCERNCSCWGVVYNNATGFCYTVDYPIQTMVDVGDETKVGYFKVRKGADKGKKKVGLGLGIGVVGGALVILMVMIGFGSYRIWKRRRGVKRFLEEEGGVSPGPYRDLGSASFKSIEMCNR